MSELYVNALAALRERYVGAFPALRRRFNSATRESTPLLIGDCRNTVYSVYNNTQVYFLFKLDI